MKPTRKLILPGLAVVLLLSCVVYSFAASNDKHNAAAAELYDEDYYFLENLASEKYNYLLRAWSNGARYLTKDTIVYPSFYAGAMSDDNKNLVILVSQLDQDVVDYFGSLIDLDHVRFTQVSSSLNELFDAKDIVNRYIRDRENPELCSAITATGISYDQNAVNIYLKFDTPSHITDAIAEQFSIENGFPCKIQFLEFEHNPPDDPVPNPPS